MTFAWAGAKKESHVGDLSPMEPDSTELSLEDSMELMVIEDELGTALIGTEDAIAAFAQEWDTALAPVQIDSGATLSKMAIQIFGTRTVRSAYAVRRQAHELFSRPESEVGVTYHKMVRNPQNGRIVSHARIPNPGAMAGVGPQMAAIAALEAAISAQFDRVHEHLDVIEDKVDELLRLAAANRIGDVYGHHRLLSARLKDLASGHELTNTDWSTIASLGPDLEVGVERLRVHAFKQLETLDGRAGPGKRSEQLEQMLIKNRLGETLQLQVVAQKSLFQWYKLKLEQVRNAEPQYMDQTITSARATLSAQHEADIQLAMRLREVLATHAVLRLSEVHHKIIARGLGRHRDALREMLDQFIQARNLQIEQWDTPEHARIADVFVVAKDRTSDLVTSGRRQLARGAEAVSTWAEPNPKEPAED